MSCCGGPRSAPDFDCDAEGLSREDLERFGGDEIECPSCGEPVFAEAPMCPRCGVAIMAEHDAAEGSRQTVTVLMVGMVVAMAALGVAIF
jgi:ribosomal protein S27AE